MTPGGRILYVSYDGLMEPLGSAQVAPVVTGLARLGFSITLLSFEKPGDLSAADRMGRVRLTLEDAGVTWIPLPYHAWPSLPATGYDIWQGAREIRRVIRGERGRVVVHARSYVAAGMGLRGMAPFRRRKGEGGDGPRLLFDMRGFWVDERIEAGRWRAGSAVVKLARRTEGRLLREADWLVHLTRAGMENVERLAWGVDLPPSSVIPTSVDLSRFRPPEDRGALRRELGLGQGPVVIHSGTLSGWYLGTETFRLGRSLVEDSGGDFVVLTREVELAEALSRKEGVRVRIRTVPHEEIPRWLGASDVGLCLVRPGFAKSASSPTRIGEYLAAGLLVVASKGVGDLDAQFSGSRVALAVDPFQNPGTLALRVLDLLARENRGVEARDLARRYYDLTDAVGEYARIHEELGVKPCGS